LLEFDEPYDLGFEIDASTLAFLASRNSFFFSDQQPVRIIGLRGCVLPDGQLDSGWGLKHALTLAEPDHINRQCIIGLWRSESGEIRLFAASTVPQASNMFRALKRKGDSSSLLPTGLYRYSAGTHNASSKHNRQQPGALRVAQKYVVLRTTQDLTYNVFSDQNYWTQGTFHNIHAATVGKINPHFDSSGCQVIRGNYTSDRRKGTEQWGTFQREIGTAGTDGTVLTSSGGGVYEYMLLTGLEAALYFHNYSNFQRNYARLRPGSSGENVLDLRRRLIQRIPFVLGNDMPPPSTNFDWQTSFAVLMAHKETTVNEHVSTVWSQ
jgi:hypothetical protein